MFSYDFVMCLRFLIGSTQSFDNTTHATKLHDMQHIYQIYPHFLFFIVMKQFLKPVGVSKTSVVNRSFDEMGNVMWQQEAAEFVEKYPQRRRPKSAALLLRQSASAGTLYRKPDACMPTLNKRASGGELLTPQHRHQRDMFSGDLGIPDVNSHVGSVVHTFETMAMQRQLAERQRAQREHEHSKYLVELLAMQAAAAAIAATTNTTTAPTTKPSTTPPTSSKRTFIQCGTTTSNHSNSSKLQQLKKKTQETRQKIVQHILQQTPIHLHTLTMHAIENNPKKPATPRHIVLGPFQASSNSEVYYGNIDDDYRKNLFGTLGQRKVAPFEDIPTQTNEMDSNSFCEDTQVVNQAFDEIFEGYSGLEEEDDIKDKQTDSLAPPDQTPATNFMNLYARPGLTPKKLPAISHKKGPPPPPPKAGSSSGQTKRKIMPFSENKQRSSTFHNLIERLKTPPRKSPTPLNQLGKTSSDSLLKIDPLPMPSNKYLHKFPAHLHLNREVEGQESPSSQDQDFLRGSTLSQSFVRHLKVHKPSKGKAPAAPQQTQSAKHPPLKTSEALRQVLLFSKRSKSSGELLPHCDEYTTVEPRKYYRRLEESDEHSQRQQLQYRERFIDGATLLANVAGNRIQQTVEI
ncbi:uncharacterized protein LOC106086104 [Stomoxys calcitrans]|uniref:uncharacterized protein LOC106086104 n=1 Tax=Stomoxys calcitrans TaxID=35570 RepID=UPI0027E299C1|nr:uncharacterized protein LOC106086104 [Stomoxys calcitrans]